MPGMETKTEITNGITTGVELRKHRGLEIAALARIDKVEGLYIVPGRPAFAAAKKVGATPYIMFKENTTGGVGGLFKKAFHYFSFHKEEFLNHYHQRSNVESTVMMMKAKFGDAVRSKSDVAAKNEVLCKVLCHNICCLISAIYELGLDPVFKFGDCTKTSSPAHKPGDI